LIDIQLIEECRGGNFNNFRKLVELSSPFAYSVAFRMLGDEDQAKDIVQETSKIIRILTERLSPKQKTVFILSDIEEMSNDEVSEITGIGKSAVKANLHYARKSISEMVEKYL